MSPDDVIVGAEISVNEAAASRDDGSPEDFRTGVTDRLMDPGCRFADKFVEWFPSVDAQRVRTLLEHETGALQAAPSR